MKKHFNALFECLFWTLHAIAFWLVIPPAIKVFTASGGNAHYILGGMAAMIPMLLIWVLLAVLLYLPVRMTSPTGAGTRA